MSYLEPGHKRLKDFPRGEWMDAADVCDLCGARPQVRIEWVDESGDYGDVTVIEKHSPGCPEELRDDAERRDSAGWEYTGHTLRLADREWPVIDARFNVGVCLGCGRLVVGVPLILFLNEGRGGELDFCFSCALELGVLDKLGVTRGE